MASTIDPAVVSSSSTLWATPSKEWVIQPKPKPGRKPKKDPPAISKADDDVDTNGRRVQNRAAQRAFRERKQSQLAELQARIQSYEQGEIERNVALQNIAKRLKDENQTLRTENASLKEKLSEMAQQLENDRKRWRDETPSSTRSFSHPVKRQRMDSTPFPLSIPFSSPSPPSIVSSPESDSTSDTPFSPIQLEPSPVDPSHPSLNNLITMSANNKSGFEASDIFSTFACGLCTPDTHCVCRQVAFHHAADAMATPGLKYESYEPKNTIINIEPSTPSILENLPPYQPPVPLRRRQLNTRSSPVFRAVPASTSCSGDPSNCEACANDSFGQAFCEAINQSVSARRPCVDCPCNQGSEGCGQSPSQTTTTRTDPSDYETIPTNDAWQQLKSHPGVSFADLALLADVVARRSKCTGPRVSLSPVPNAAEPSDSAVEPDSQAILLTDPHAHYREKLGRQSSPALVPQEVLVKCGQERVRQVQTAGVRDALRLLDARLV